MKMFKTILIAVMAFATVGVSAQTVDEIVSKNLESMGGKDKLAALKSIIMSGNMTASGTDMAIIISKLHNVGMRMDLDIMGTANYQLFNNKSGWVFFPVMGMTEPKEMEAAQYKGSVNQLDAQGALYNYKEKGTTIELLGNEKVDGADAYKLKITYKNGHSATLFIDTKTHRHVKSISKSVANGQEVEVETTFGDFKQNAEGYWFPYSMTNAQGTISFDKIETNVDIKESIFVN
ncbi:MAG: hypothetical protein WKF35_11785 [Ferruginibacter sp.]